MAGSQFQTNSERMITESTSHRRIRNPSINILMLVFFLAAQLCCSKPGDAQEKDLTGMSIEALMDVKVTSVSKKKQHLSESAAAIFVITNEDLRRSGVTNIPDALRMVPGLNVARIDSNKWAVNSRGSASRFSGSLLVLIDGRSVYTPSFSGVYWEVQDVMLEDVARIEVIRGPGAALWGANAVNGVINIITRSAADTQGGLVSLGGGSYEKAFAGLRYGAPMGANTHGRFYAKGFERDQFQYPDGNDAGDDWGMRQGGFRIDSDLTASDSLTFQSDIYQGDINQQLDLPSLTFPYAATVADSVDVSGGNVLLRWQRILSSTSELSLQGYYDRTDREEAYANQELDTFDLDFQHLLRAGDRHDIIWGLRYRSNRSEVEGTPTIKVDPSFRNDDLFSAFFQDEITLLTEQLWLTLGAKVEHNDYTGWEVQPGARVFWAVDEDHKFWGAVSRAVRTPSRVETDAQFVNIVIPPADSFTPPVALTIMGNDKFESEDLLAYELGYRFLPKHSFSLDVAFFYNDYSNLKIIKPGMPVFQGTYINRPLSNTNDYSAHTYGAELAIAWQVIDPLKLGLSYTYLDSDQENNFQGGIAPEHLVSLLSTVTLREDLDLDLWLRYVDDATMTYIGSPDLYYRVDDYFTFDMRLAWRPIPSLELSLVGQNLLDSSHLEAVQAVYTPPTEVQRSVYGKITYRF
jgi:iron complex outermembrane recepter protein